MSQSGEGGEETFYRYCLECLTRVAGPQGLTVQDVKTGFRERREPRYATGESTVYHIVHRIPFVTADIPGFETGFAAEADRSEGDGPLVWLEGGSVVNTGSLEQVFARFIRNRPASRTIRFGADHVRGPQLEDLGPAEAAMERAGELQGVDPDSVVQAIRERPDREEAPEAETVAGRTVRRISI